MEKFNKESGLSNYFAPRNITRGGGQVRVLFHRKKERIKNEEKKPQSISYVAGGVCHLLQCGVHHTGDRLLQHY